MLFFRFRIVRNFFEFRFFLLWNVWPFPRWRISSAAKRYIQGHIDCILCMHIPSFRICMGDLAWNLRSPWSKFTSATFLEIKYSEIWLLASCFKWKLQGTFLSFILSFELVWFLDACAYYHQELYQTVLTLFCGVSGKVHPSPRECFNAPKTWKDAMI